MQHNIQPREFNLFAHLPAGLSLMTARSPAKILSLQLYFLIMIIVGANFNWFRICAGVASNLL
jgi:hypothetical protein